MGARKDPLRRVFLVGFEIARGLAEGGVRRSGTRLLAGATTRGRFDLAGFVNDTRKLFDDVSRSEALGFGEVDEGDMCATEEFFHFFGGATGVFCVVFNAIFELDGADGA